MDKSRDDDPPTGMPEDQPEEAPLGVPEADPDSDAADTVPGIPTEREPPAAS